jgi:hypothetical protein
LALNLSIRPAKICRPQTPWNKAFSRFKKAASLFAGCHNSVQKTALKSRRVGESHFADG